MSKEIQKLTRADFTSKQEVRWCPGCGDYAILSSVQKLFPQLGIPKENIVMISGIGCSGRFPYYMDTFGFHTIHGRALPIATGLKMTRPELSIWVVTGDGDALSIGGNHLIHCLRRNPNINILLFNNEIYGLTKGQYSPTSEAGIAAASTPYGSLDKPLNPLSLALSAGASFVARGLDVDVKGLQELMTAAYHHNGTAIIEIYQNCPIYNDGAFAKFSERKVRADRMLWLKPGEPMLFGHAFDKAIVNDNDGLQVSDSKKENLLIHDVANLALAQQLTQMNYPDYPVPMGVFYQKERPAYEKQVQDQVDERISHSGKVTLESILETGQVWDIK